MEMKVDRQLLNWNLEIESSNTENVETLTQWDENPLKLCYWLDLIIASISSINNTFGWLTIYSD